MSTARQAALTAVVTGIALLGMYSYASAAEPRSASQADTEQKAPRAKQALALVYKPPQRGAPGGRVGGATRGTRERDTFVLSVLAPDHTGLTVSEQPSLFWFISAETTLPVELTLVDPNAVEPVLEVTLASPVQHGIHRVRLADYGVRLKQGVAYQWSIAIVPDGARRSRDILASGAIERIEPASEWKTKLASARGEGRAALYAESGIWYDALEAISDLIDTAPADDMPRRYRAALLAQGGLPEIAQ
ncbi:MAG: DUF928 domain-containing protein [Betaproteobacteria bacterium]